MRWYLPVTRDGWVRNTALPQKVRSRFTAMVETKADAVSCAISPKFTEKGEGCLTTMGDTMAVRVLKKAGGDTVCANCELADTPLKRVRGLLGRSELAED